VIGNPVGYFCHAFLKITEGLGLKKEEITEM